MAQSPRTIPSHYPQPLAAQVLKAEAQRQISIVRQEIVTELLSVLSETRETNVRIRLLRLIEANFKSGVTAARRAQELWPDMETAKSIIEKNGAAKPATMRKQLQLLERLGRMQERSLKLLEDSFESVRLILERVRPTADTSPGLEHFS